MHVSWDMWLNELGFRICSSIFYDLRRNVGHPKVRKNKAKDDKGIWTKPVFVDLLRSPGVDFQPGGAGRYDNPICRTGPPVWQNRFLEIESKAP